MKKYRYKLVIQRKKFTILVKDELANNGKIETKSFSVGSVKNLTSDRLCNDLEKYISGPFMQTVKENIIIIGQRQVKHASHRVVIYPINGMNGKSKSFSFKVPLGQYSSIDIAKEIYRYLGGEDEDF
ncbi:MAG: hypothetical protein U9R08_03485 [Nanoarchaeota archaeon]|nr:hypothetical protein [Nanoarchaeota archaeon]